MSKKKAGLERAPKGRLLMEFDKAGAEWVVVAYASGDPRMIEVLSTPGRSPHTTTGALIAGCSEELVAKENKIVGSNTDPTLIEELRREKCPEVYDLCRFLPRNMSIRQCGKKSNHGINYDMGPREFSEFSELDEASCKRVIQLYKYEAYTHVPLWHQSIQRELKENGRVLTNCFGHKRRFLDRWDNMLFKAAYAYIPQSTVVGMVNRAMRLFTADESKDLADFQLLAQVHDSLVFNSPVLTDFKSVARGAVKIALDYMNPELVYSDRPFRIGTDMKVGLNWSSNHMIGVELTRDIDKLAKDLRVAWEQLNDGQEKAA